MKKSTFQKQWDVLTACLDAGSVSEEAISARFDQCWARYGHLPEDVFSKAVQALIWEDDRKWFPTTGEIETAVRSAIPQNYTSKQSDEEEEVTHEERVKRITARYYAAHPEEFERDKARYREQRARERDARKQASGGVDSGEHPSGQSGGSRSGGSSRVQ